MLFAVNTFFINKARSLNELTVKSKSSVKTAESCFNTNNMKTNSEKYQQRSSGVINFLGITLYGNLCWKGHVANLCKKLSSGLFAIRRIKQLLGERKALLAYQVQFHSSAIYDIIIIIIIYSQKHIKYVQKTRQQLQRILFHQNIMTQAHINKGARGF